ncbi:MAG: DUF5813 family protein [Haloarculaceae archaeon]
MTDETPTAVREAAANRDAFEATTGGYEVTTTRFDARVTARPGSAEWATGFTVTVEVPTLPAAVDGEVGDAVAEGWLETFERRLAEAPKSTRTSVDPDLSVTAGADTVTVTYEFEFGSERRGLDVAKAFVEYVEGTYVEGVVPGYDYRPPVSDLLSGASQGDGERGGTPL